MAVYKLAVIIKSPSDDEFLLVRQIPPPKLPEEEYQNYVDSDLWDLPSAPLVPNENESSRNMVEGAESCAHQLNLQKFDVSSALDQVLSQVGLGKSSGRPWVFWKYVEEAEFGPEPLVHMVFILGKLKPEEAILQEVSKWLSIQSAGNLLFKVKPRNDRIGPLVVIGFGPDLAISTQLQAPHSLRFQEYPPGVIVVPMRSRTLKPFRTTNLVLIAPDNVTDSSRDSCSVAYGDALLMDPGCHSNFHAESLYGQLMEIVTALPRKLVVFVTHHHPDHVEGLSVIQKCNPDATLLAHENTMRRIGKDLWSLGYTRISGGEEVCIGGQQLNVVSAPGHTDGHMALLHVGTHSLIVGDHCVGHGSAVLDIGSGGNMMDYFQTTYNFLELAPHALIPMHGRINLWPMRMLCGYLKHRRDRESSILAAIESGAVTLFDVIAKSYPDLDSSLMWLASFNVRLHVDHLASQGMLPKEFSMERFQASFGFHFVSRWIWRCLKERVTIKAQGLGAVELFTAIAVAGFAMFLHYQIQTESISNS